MEFDVQLERLAWSQCLVHALRRNERGGLELFGDEAGDVGKRRGLFRLFLQLHHLLMGGPGCELHGCGSADQNSKVSARRWHECLGELLLGNGAIVDANGV